jgi:hypothetical protein
MIIICAYVPIMPYFYGTKPFINLKNDWIGRMHAQSLKLWTEIIIYLTI